MKNLHFWVLSALLICNGILFAQLYDSNQKLEVLYLAQERAELSASLWFEKGQNLEKEKRYREAQDAYHKAQMDPRTSIAGKAERAFYASQAYEMINRPENIDPNTTDALVNTLRAQGGNQALLATAIELIADAERGANSPPIERVATLFAIPALAESICVSVGTKILERRAPKRAIDLLSACAEAMPTSGKTWKALAQAFQADKQEDEYKNAMEKALSLTPNAQLNLQYAQSLMAKKQWQAAIDRLTILPKNKTDIAQQLRLLGACYFQLKQYQKAANSYQSAYEAQPDPKTLISKVITLRSGGLTEQALETLDMLNTVESRVPEIHFQRGQILAENKDNAGAAKAFSRYLRLARGKQSEKSRINNAQAWLLKYRGPATKPTPQSPRPAPIKSQHIGAPPTP